MPRLFLLSLFLLILFPRPLDAQNGPYDQDSSSLKWKTLDNEFVQVIYPDYLKPKAIEVANLIEHYSKVVGQSYGIDKPKKVSLILRPDFADPNGFVTLGPRRSEWHAMGTFSPLTSSLDWYQILSIHEYRHVNQFDYFQQDSVQVLNYIFGDYGIQIAAGIGLQAWFFEGDAVHTETAYSDGGRGRYPNFMARMKGVLLDAEGIPSYDQFLNGSYKRPLPNHYVYGYILVAEGYRRFGKDFWGKVIEDVAGFPHPWRLVSMFERHSRMPFKTFYQETFQDLQADWKPDRLQSWSEKKDYVRDTDWQEFSGTSFFVRYDLDSQPRIMRQTGDSAEAVAEIPYHPELLRVEFSPDYAVYPEFRRHWRWGQKSNSDLALINLKDGSKKYLTEGGRYYNPNFSANQQSIYAAEFFESKVWRIAEIDLSGKRLRTLTVPGLDLMEAVPVEGGRVVALANDSIGKKSLVLLSFDKGLVKTLLPASRNVLFALSSDSKSKVVFQAQAPGSVEIFLYDTEQDAVSRCTQSPISAALPSISSSKIHYSSETPYGFDLKTEDISACKTITKSDLQDFRYLGKGPSDNLTTLAPLGFADQAEVLVKPSVGATEDDYNRFDARAFTPHSWNFFVGRGVGLEAQTDNYLNDFGMQLRLGREAEENTPYSSLQVDFKMFAPVFSLLASGQKRANELPETDQRLNWNEWGYGGRVSLPYFHNSGLYQTTAEIAYAHQSVKTWDYKIDDTRLRNRDNHFQIGTASLALSWLKNSTYRSLLPPLGLQLLVTQDNAAPKEEDIASHTARTFGEAKIFLPSLFNNHGIRIGFAGERNTTGLRGYEYVPPSSQSTEYVLARGYDYEPLDRFSKWSADYAFPIANPDFNLRSVYHLKRISMDLFYDSSRTYFLDKHEVKESAGVETYLESRIFRVLPLTLGVRYVRRFQDDSDRGEIFAASDIAVF